MQCNQLQSRMQWHILELPLSKLSKVLNIVWQNNHSPNSSLYSECCTCGLLKSSFTSPLRLLRFPRSQPPYTTPWGRGRFHSQSLNHVRTVFTSLQSMYDQPTYSCCGWYHTVQIFIGHTRTSNTSTATLLPFSWPHEVKCTLSYGPLAGVERTLAFTRGPYAEVNVDVDGEIMCLVDQRETTSADDWDVWKWELAHLSRWTMPFRYFRR